MKLGKWHEGSELPKKTDWYLRDYRNIQNRSDAELPPFSVDKYIEDVNGGGFWYVMDGDSLNDANYEELPWCKIKE